jgi:hypothetical protein
MARGVLRIASSEIVIIVGKAMIASTTLPAKAVSPTGKPKDFELRAR